MPGSGSAMISNAKKAAHMPAKTRNDLFVKNGDNKVIAKLLTDLAKVAPFHSPYSLCSSM